jgi:hypothetical protein
MFLARLGEIFSIGMVAIVLSGASTHGSDGSVDMIISEAIGCVAHVETHCFFGVMIGRSDEFMHLCLLGSASPSWNV